MATHVTLREAEKAFSALIGRVQGGEEIVIDEGGQPVARLLPAIPGGGDRKPGSAQGLFVVPEDFNHPLPADVLDDFEK
jgi:antitoxin (DNA-binding transcriptional repressor) of toxin-antitoxin stability system